MSEIYVFFVIYLKIMTHFTSSVICVTNTSHSFCCMCLKNWCSFYMPHLHTLAITHLLICIYVHSCG